MKKANVDSQVRGFFFAQAGNDAFDGTTNERPKATIQAAIDAANALVPAPSAVALAQVSASQGGAFTTGFVLSDFILFDAENILLLLDQPIGITIASFSACQITTILNTAVNGKCFEIDGEQALGINSRQTNINGTDGIGFNVTGICDSLFLNTNLMQVNGLRGIGYKITSSTTVPIDINVDTALLGGNDSVFMEYDPVNATDECVVNVSSISAPTATGTFGYKVKNGVLIIIQQGILDAETAIQVESGATCVLDIDNVIGDIIVDVGGTLEVNVIRFSGTITNNGTINGRIGNTLFGDWEIFPAIIKFDANNAIYPSTSPAVADSRNGHPIIAFDDTTAENVIFNSIISSNYGGADIDIDIDWVAATAITGDVVWGAEFERNAPGGNDIDSDDFATQQTASNTTNGTSGIITRTTITLTLAEADGITAEDSFRMRIQRVAADVGDTMTGDAQILKIGVS